MTSSSRSLLRAADSRRHESEPEDRLTEILSEVLMTAPPLTAWLVAQAFGTVEPGAVRLGYGDYTVHTQVSLAGGGRPDMEIRFTGERAPPGRLFCENKIRARFTKWQVDGYPSVLEPGRIVVLSPSGDRRPMDGPKFVPLSWTSLGREADRIGRTWAGSEWRSEAMGPAAPSQYRLLAELVWYLEQEEGVDVTIPSPITKDDLDILPDVNAAVVRWKQFRGLVLAEVQKRRGPGLYTEKWEKRWDPEGIGGEKLACSLTLRYGDGWEGAAWPALNAALEPPKWSWQELFLVPQAPWMNQDVPCIGVGVGLLRLPDWTDDMTEWARLRETVLAIEGAWLGPTNRNTIYRIVLARPLSEIAAGAETLDAQAQAAVQWASTALDDLVAIE